MRDRPAFAARAALGWVTTAVGLLICALSARAHELTSQHPSDALQKQLDQIERASPDPGPAPSTDAASGSFPRSYRIPGTDTSIRVYGTATETLDYSLSR